MGRTAFLFPGQGVKGGFDSQIDIFLISCGAYDFRIQNGEKPDMVAGHSFGEFGALVAAGVLDFQTAESLIVKRQVLMNKACRDHRGWMVAIMGPLEPLKTICGKFYGDVWFACYNSPTQHVISGKIPALQRVLSELGKAGRYRAKTLNVSGAFHSPLMAEANKRFCQYFEEIEFASPQIAYYSTATGDRIDNSGEIKAALMQQMIRPVFFEEAVRSMMRDGATDLVEMEPAGVLTRLIEQIRKGP